MDIERVEGERKERDIPAKNKWIISITLCPKTSTLDKIHT